jgi:uncharacterized membrane protein HdeD (DUF308 family)
MLDSLNLIMGINLYKYWWLLSIKAVLILTLGLAIIIRTDQSFVFTATLAGVLIALGGIAVLAGAFSHMKFNNDWTWWLYEGLGDIIIGTILMLRPAESCEVFIVLLAVWFLISGILHFVTAINIQYYLSNRFVLYISGVVAVASGVFLIYSTFRDFYRQIYIIGLLAIIYGFLVFCYSVQLKDVVVEEIDEIDYVH